MKKVYLLAAMAIAAAGFTACGNSAPKESLKSDVDSLSYAFGVDQGQGVKQYLQQMQIDTAYIDEFVKGMNDRSRISTIEKYMRGDSLRRRCKHSTLFLNTKT